jgi:hypothetical protein
MIRRQAIKNDSSAILRSGKRFVARAADTELPERTGKNGPPLSCLAYKQEWPPKKDGHSCAVKVFGAA